MTPIEYYQKLIGSEEILRDPQQEKVVQHLQIIFDHLTLTKKSSSSGLYIWGDVGVGKTFLMDSFFYCLPFKNKLRIHFHKFMKMIHEQLKTLSGQVDPIAKLAKQIAKENRVICFDELFVNDIADAMLLAGLFEKLYAEKTCILFTSNSPPDSLYLHGIQRESFLPAIDLIKKNSSIVEMTSQTDYRLRNPGNTFYLTPIDDNTHSKLEQQFETHSQEQPITTTPIRILDRNIKVQKVSGEVVWFDFSDICGVPRSQNDYVEIAKQFDTILVSNVTVIQPEQNDLARSFINLVDVMYDSNKKLIISAEKPIEQIYYCGRLLFEFARTRSRIIEMQTASWHEKCDLV